MKLGTKIRAFGIGSLCAIVFGCSNSNILGPSTSGEMTKTNSVWTTQRSENISGIGVPFPIGTSIMTSNISGRTVDYMLWIANPIKDTLHYEFNPMIGGDVKYSGTVLPNTMPNGCTSLSFPSATYPDSCGDTVRPRSKVYIENSCDTFPNGAVIILK